MGDPKKRFSSPPPGNTTTAARVLFPVGEYIVIVGRETLLTDWVGLPGIRFVETSAVSGPPVPAATASGTVPGHIGTCICPRDGCQTDVCAIKLTDQNTTQRA